MLIELVSSVLFRLGILFLLFFKLVDLLIVIKLLVVLKIFINKRVNIKNSVVNIGCVNIVLKFLNILIKVILGIFVNVL